MSAGLSLSQVILAIPIWWLNGVLFSLYWLAGHLYDFAVILNAAVLAFGIDPIVQARATSRERRYGRGEVQTSFPAAQYFTLTVLVVWLIVSFTSDFPVPLIGAVLWASGLVSILAVSEERFNQMWWMKVGLLVYAGVVLLLRYGLATLNLVDPADWAGVVGSSADARVVLTNTRGNLAMIGMLFTLVLYPVGYIAMLFNRFIRNPKPLFNIWTEASDVLNRLRTRT